jgi:hypothetical protein
VGTFTSKEIVDKLIAINGNADPVDGPRFDIVKIVQYTTPEGDPDNWGVVYRCEVPLGMADRYDRETEYLKNPKVIFERKEP